MRLSVTLRDEVESLRRANRRWRDWTDEVVLALSVVAALALIAFSGSGRQSSFAPAPSYVAFSVGAMAFVGALSSLLLGLSRSGVRLREHLLRLASRLTRAAGDLRQRPDWRHDDYERLRRDLTRAAKLEAEHQQLLVQLARLEQMVNQLEQTQDGAQRQDLVLATASGLETTATQLAEVATTGRT
jgi:hypothetical protein